MKQNPELGRGRWWLWPTASLCLAALGLGVLTEAMAWLTWELAVAGGRPVKGEAVPNRHPRVSDAQRLHRVGLWPVERPRKFQQAPSLDAQALPPVAERLPGRPCVITPPETRGPYGGAWRRFAANAARDIQVQIRWRITYEHLIRWDPVMQTLVPNVAESWTTSSDARVFRFTLRKGMRWSDGHPYTVDDIVFWYEHLLKNRTFLPTPYKALMVDGKLMELEKLDDHRFEVRFAAPNALFLQRLASDWEWPTEMVNTPAHYLKQFHPAFTSASALEALVVQNQRSGWPELVRQKLEWDNRECPRIWAWTLDVPPPATQVRFTRNPWYWKVDPDGNQLPYLDAVTFEVVGSETLAFKILNGECHMQMRGIPPSQYSLIMKNRRRGGYAVRHWLGGARTKALFLNLNHKDPALRDLFLNPEFRRALSIGIDREEINRTVFRGAGKPRQVCPAPGSRFDDPALATRHTEFDPGAANAILDGLGLVRGDDGIRRRPDGKPLRLVVDTTEQESVLINLVVEYWNRLGVQAVQKVQSTQLLYARKAALEHDVIAGSGGGELNPLLDPRYYMPIGGESNQAIAWGMWHSSGGRQGLRPPARVREMLGAYARLQSEADPQQQTELFLGILAANRAQPFSIGLVAGEVPIVVVGDGFRNVPDVASPAWDCRAPGNCAPEVFALAVEHRRGRAVGGWGGILSLMGGLVVAWWIVRRMLRSESDPTGEGPRG